ncbi:MAG: hypothetical protein Q9190_005496 [Brigantiaea leucoxantha]
MDMLSVDGDEPLDLLPLDLLQQCIERLRSYRERICTIFIFEPGITSDIMLGLKFEVSNAIGHLQLVQRTSSLSFNHKGIVMLRELTHKLLDATEFMDEFSEEEHRVSETKLFLASRSAVKLHIFIRALPQRAASLDGPLHTTNKAEHRAFHNTMFNNFCKALDTIYESSSGLLSACFSLALRVLWTQFLDLIHIEYRVGNVPEPGVDFKYDNKHVQYANFVLSVFRKAWMRTRMQEVFLPKKLTAAGKICLTLNRMQCQDFLEDFLNSGCTDRDLPLHLERLATILKARDPHYALIFFKNQYLFDSFTREDRSYFETPKDDSSHLSIVYSLKKPFSSGIMFNGEDLLMRNGAQHYFEEAKIPSGFEHRHVMRKYEPYTGGDPFNSNYNPLRGGLAQMLERYTAKDTFHSDGYIDRVWLRPTFLTAFGCLSLALEHIHDRNIVHGDIGPFNILLGQETTSDIKFFLTGFYYSQFFHQARPERIHITWYSAPETLDGGGFYGPHCDVFALGCVFLQLLSCLQHEALPLETVPSGGGFPRFAKSIPALQDWTKRLHPLDEIPSISGLGAIAAQMIHSKPQKRPTSAQVVRAVANHGPRPLCFECSQELSELAVSAESSYRSLDPKSSEFDSSGDDSNLASESPSIALQSTADKSLLSDFYSVSESDSRDMIVEIVSLFLDDETFSNLIGIALRRGNPQKTSIYKFSRLLKLYGRKLKEASSTGAEEAAAKFVHSKSTHIANQIQMTWSFKERYAEQSADGESNFVQEPRVVRRTRMQSFVGQKVLSKPNHFDELEEEDAKSQDDNSSNDEDSIKVKALKEFLIHTGPFLYLRQAFWRMLFPNPLKGIAYVISSAFDNSGTGVATRTAKFHVQWNLKAYVATELEYGRGLCATDQVLNRVLAISGTASESWAGTAQDYVRWKWPKAKINLAEVLSTFLREDFRDTLYRRRRSGKCSVSFACKDSKTGELLVEAVGSVQDLIEIGQQLAWLCASLRQHVSGQLSYSDVGFTEVEKGLFQICPLKLEEVRGRKSACWLPLFLNGVIARGFPIPSRHEEDKGVELPFRVMTTLAKIMYPSSHLGGVFLKGFSCILYPTATSVGDKIVQWHMTTPSNLMDYLPPGYLPPSDSPDSWIKSSELEGLVTAKRTFLGYARTIKAHVGTNSREARQSILATMPPAAEDEDPIPGLEINKIQTGTSGLGIWGFQAEADIVYPKGLYHAVEKSWYVDMLDRAKNAPVIVYDHAEKSRRAWLLPTLSVVLHMAHIWARDKELTKKLPAAQVRWDLGEAAYSVVKEHGKDEIRDSLEDGKQYCVRDLISRLLICLEKLQEVEAVARGGNGQTVSLGPNSRLYGWDLLNLDQDWRILALDVPVLFCQNVGELIQPAPTIKVCAAGNPAKLGQDHLIATVKCLRWLSNKRGQPTDSRCLRLGNRVFWLSPGPELFDDCTICLEPSFEPGVGICLKQGQQILHSNCAEQETAALPIEGVVGLGPRQLQRTGIRLPRLRASRRRQKHKLRAGRLWTAKMPSLLSIGS